MKKHLKYIDGTSDKFWQIEVSGENYTVTYGKNGTSGVSQTKSFASAEECLKAAEKLLAEKEKKGYSENGEVIVSSPKAIVTKSGKKSDTATLLKEYDQIILSEKKELLLPFLEENSKGNVELLKNHIKKCKRYWMTFMDLSNEPGFKFKKKEWLWGTRGSDKQKQIISLSGLALFGKSDITGWDEVLTVLENTDDPINLAVMQWAKPNWVDFFILDRIKKNEWTTFSYRNLRKLEDKGLIEYNPELYTLCLGNYSSWREKVPTLDFIHEIVNDKTAYERDVPQLFNYQTNLHNCTYRLNENDTESLSAWTLGYKLLLEQNKMPLDVFIENAIQIQTKDWNNNLKSFFRKRIDELNLSADQLIPFQENIFPFLHNAYPPITSYGMELVKKMYEHPKFKTKSFLEWLEPLMMRTDCKAGIKLALPLLEKLSKANPKLNKNIASVLADVYMIPDLSLQERVTKIIVKIGNKKDTELIDKLTNYMPLIQGSVKSNLSTLLDAETLVADQGSLEEYVYNPVVKKVLTEAVPLPKDWNEIVYLFGNFISSNEVLDTEMLFNVFVTQRHLFPADFTKQLQPYAKQLDKSYFDSKHKQFASVFLEHKIKTVFGRINIEDNTYNKIKTLKSIDAFINKVQDKISNNSTIPLLSFPSHKPHWVAPKVLLERLIEHQKSRESIMALDLAVAIARMPRENVEEALPLLEKISGELKDIMSFALGLTKEIKLPSGSLFNRLASTIGIPTQNSESIAFWAVAARTFYPEETFPAFESTAIKNVPFVVKPFIPEVKMEEKWYYTTNWQTKKKEKSPSWYELSFKMPENKNPEPYLLYSLDINKRDRDWEHMINSPGNVYYWNSLMPQNSEPLALSLLYSTCHTSEGSNQELKGFLEITNQPGFRFSDTSTLIFACCFFMQQKELRLLASEILINLIEDRAINIDLLANKMAFLASEKYGAFGRLAEALATIKDISPVHNHALFLLMDKILGSVEFKEKLPANFKKMVENYVDVLSKTQQKPSPETVAFFKPWKDNATLKSLIKEIL